ncbi:MAG: hypothetical protein Kow0077_19690 [Anaerolineae bacterium]
MAYELVMYIRNRGCPYVSTARLTLGRLGVRYREVNIDQDDSARAWLLETVGFLSVPTLVVAEQGQDRPSSPPEPLAQGKSPRGIDRGSIITEPSSAQLSVWLEKHGFTRPTS